MSDSEYTPGTYVKGNTTRVANSTSEAVALRFEGYRKADSTPEVSESVEVTEPVATPPTSLPRPPRANPDKD